MAFVVLIVPLTSLTPPETYISTRSPTFSALTTLQSHRKTTQMVLRNQLCIECKMTVLDQCESLFRSKQKQNAKWSQICQLKTYAFPFQMLQCVFR